MVSLTLVGLKVSVVLFTWVTPTLIVDFQATGRAAPHLAALGVGHGSEPVTLRSTYERKIEPTTQNTSEQKA